MTRAPVLLPSCRHQSRSTVMLVTGLDHMRTSCGAEGSHRVSHVVHTVSAQIQKSRFLQGPAWPLYPGQPRPPNTDKKAFALAEQTGFGPLVAFVSPTETLNIEQLFYLMRQNFMAASIKLCQPSVLWQQSLNFLKFHPFFFFFQ